MKERKMKARKSVKTLCPVTAKHYAHQCCRCKPPFPPGIATSKFQGTSPPFPKRSREEASKRQPIRTDAQAILACTDRVDISSVYRCMGYQKRGCLSGVCSFTVCCLSCSVLYASTASRRGCTKSSRRRRKWMSITGAGEPGSSGLAT